MSAWNEFRTFWRLSLPCDDGDFTPHL